MDVHASQLLDRLRQDDHFAGHWEVEAAVRKNCRTALHHGHLSEKSIWKKKNWEKINVRILAWTLSHIMLYQC